QGRSGENTRVLDVDHAIAGMPADRREGIIDGAFGGSANRESAAYACRCGTRPVRPYVFDDREPACNKVITATTRRLDMRFQLLSRSHRIKDVQRRRTHRWWP